MSDLRDFYCEFLPCAAAFNCVKVSSMSVHNIQENKGLHSFLIYYDMSFLFAVDHGVRFKYCKLSSNNDTERNATFTCASETTVELCCYYESDFSVSLFSILIGVSSSICSYSRVEAVCSWALTETSVWRKKN